MAIEGAFNLNETYKRLLPGYAAEFYILYTIYELNHEFIATAFGSSFIFLGILLISGVFLGAVFFLLAFDEICPVSASSINEQARQLRNIIQNAGYVIPPELQNEISASNKKIYLQKFSSTYRDHLGPRREDEYEFLTAQYQSYAQLAVISLTYSIARFLIFLKCEHFDFTLDIYPPLTACLLLIFVFFGSGGFIFFENRFKKGLTIYIWSTRFGLCFSILFLVLLINLDSLNFMTEVLLLFSAALGMIFYINYNTFFWAAYETIISHFGGAKTEVKRNVCEALKLRKDID